MQNCIKKDWLSEDAWNILSENDLISQDAIASVVLGEDQENSSSTEENERLLAQQQILMVMNSNNIIIFFLGISTHA